MAAAAERDALQARVYKLETELRQRDAERQLQLESATRQEKDAKVGSCGVGVRLGGYGGELKAMHAGEGVVGGAMAGASREKVEAPCVKETSGSVLQQRASTHCCC
jgi:hypothetical protein